MALLNVNRCIVSEEGSGVTSAPDLSRTCGPWTGRRGMISYNKLKSVPLGTKYQIICSTYYIDDLQVNLEVCDSPPHREATTSKSHVESWSLGRPGCAGVFIVPYLFERKTTPQA